MESLQGGSNTSIEEKKIEDASIEEYELDTPDMYVSHVLTFWLHLDVLFVLQLKALPSGPG